MAYNQNHNEMAKALQVALGLPEGYKVYSPFPFAGMNAAKGRNAMPDQNFFLLQNYIKIDDGKLRTVWGEGPSIYTAPPGRTIINFFHYNIAATQYAAVFLDDGTGIQINVTTLAQTPISSTPGTFYNPNNPFTACAQWGSQYLILVNNITANSYWIWDGMVFFGAGGIGPQVTVTNSGSGYTTAPTVTAFGGSGSGAAFTATISNGAVTGVTVNNPGAGYEPGDNVQLQFSGGGSDTSAILEAVITSGSVASIIVTNGGSGYTTPPTVAITSGGGSGATATAVLTGGVVTSITVDAGGSGYTSTPSVGFSGGGGSGAAAVASLSPGAVTAITVTNGGTGYTATPILTIIGGGGSGATATATIAAGAITSVAVTAGGSGYTSTPTVQISTGSNRSAAATVTLMPFGVSGAAVETYQNRVWLPFPFQSGSQNNRTKFLVSAPSSISDFAVSSGGVVFTANDSFLKVGYTNFKQSNGFLYPIADSSVSNISRISTSGVPSVTTFSYLNTDPQIGTSWRDTCQYYSRSILFANPLGAYGLYGGAVTKISDDIDDLFIDGIFPPEVAGALTPTGAVANIFNSKVYLILTTIVDPTTELQRVVMLGWDEKDWYVFTQNHDLTYIGTQEVSSNLAAWGTDGKELFPMFQARSNTLVKSIASKLYGADTGVLVKGALGFYVQTQDKSPDSSGVNLDNVMAVSETGSYPMLDIPTLKAPAPQYTFYMTGTQDTYGVNLGFSFTSTSPDFILTWLGLGYIMTGSVLGMSTAKAAEQQEE